MSEEDRILIDNLLNHNGRRAQNEAFEQVAALLYRSALWVVRKRATSIIRLRNLSDTYYKSMASDYVQEVIILLAEQDYRAIRAFKGRSKFNTYLNTIIRRHISRRLGRIQKSPEVAVGGNEKDAPTIDDAHHTEFVAVDSAPDPAERTALNDLAAIIRDCLDRLTTLARKIFELSFIEGMPTVQVAEALDISADAIASHRSRARASVRQCLLDKNVPYKDYLT